MEYGIKDLIMLIGALGVFIYGMKIMSEGLQKLAGGSLRRILSGMTKNTFFGILTGLVVTCLIQSSSATTVMVVSFVNAGLLSLTESLGVVMGANIGTTLTAWIVATVGFKVSKSVISFFVISVCFPLLFSSRNKLKNLGEFGLGFGLLFIGLGFLKKAVPDIKSNPDMLDFVQNLMGYEFGSIVIFILFGLILTVVVQSSSATTAITLILVANEWINFEMATAMILGENIGTTVTANMAAAVANVHAKRIARFHTLFNLIGVTWMLFMMGFFMDLVESIVPHIPFISGDTNLIHDALYNPDVVNSTVAGLEGDAADSYKSDVKDARTFAVATFHSLFNITNVVILVWFAPKLAQFVEKMVSSNGKEDEHSSLAFIGGGMFSTPELSILQAKKETQVMAKVVDKMCVSFMALMLEKPKQWTKLADKIKKREKVTDRLEIEISNYLTQCAAGEISQESSRQVRSLLKVVDDLESIADLFFKMTITLEQLKDRKAKMPAETEAELKEMMSNLYDLIKLMRSYLATEDFNQVNIEEALVIEDRMRQLRDKFRDLHFERVENAVYTIQDGILYNEMMVTMKKIGAHVTNVNEAIV